MRPGRVKETAKERAVRLERHKRYMKKILDRYFRAGKSVVFGGAEYFVCRKCKQAWYSEEDATAHYFEEHHVAKKHHES